jgi:hypothetical protein
VDTIYSEKPYRLTFEHRSAYLYALVEGEKDNYEISRAYWQEIADECTGKKFDRVLIVEDIVETGSIAEIYQLCSEFSQMGYGGIRIAFIDRRDEQNEENQFGELVAVNRGINVKIFNDIEGAEKWLLAA